MLPVQLLFNLFSGQLLYTFILNREVVYVFMLLFSVRGVHLHVQGPRNLSAITSNYYHLSVSNLSVTNVNQVTFTCTKLWSPVAMYMCILWVHIALFFHHGQYIRTT